MSSRAVQPTELAVLRGLRCEPDAERLRRDLAQQADAIAAVIAEAANRPTPARLEQCAHQLEAVRHLAMSYRAVLRSETEGNAHVSA